MRGRPPITGDERVTKFEISLHPSMIARLKEAGGKKGKSELIRKALEQYLPQIGA